MLMATAPQSDALVEKLVCADCGATADVAPPITLAPDVANVFVLPAGWNVAMMRGFMVPLCPECWGD